MFNIHTEILATIRFLSKKKHFFYSTNVFLIQKDGTTEVKIKIKYKIIV